MLSHKAHSFTQQARLAITLAWVAGYTNLVTILTCGTPTSHVTGIASQLGRDVAERSWPQAATACFLLGAFFLGACISGISTELGRRRRWESIYVIPVGIQAIMLACFSTGVELFGLREDQQHGAMLWMTGLAAGAMGLQNATITRISSGVVRTTHLTGVITDLGLESVQFVTWARQMVRRHKPEDGPLPHLLFAGVGARRLALLISIVGSFALGAALGTLVHDFSPRSAMVPPVFFLLWIVFQDISRPIAEIEPSVLLSPSAGLNLPDTITVHSMINDRRRRGMPQRFPDLHAWADRLDPKIRVVVLDLGEIRDLNRDAIDELRSLIGRLHEQGRALVVSGLSPAHFTELGRTGPGQWLNRHNLCSDLELAVARGLALLNTPAPASSPF